jgi:pimeloyl-ACP methyl ester carboxylesterase
MSRADLVERSDEPPRDEPGRAVPTVRAAPRLARHEITIDLGSGVTSDAVAAVATGTTLDDAPDTDASAATPTRSTTGHRVGVAVCGTGMPVVLVHGFTAEGILYAQTLSRLVGMGFKVVAIDVAGHGATAGLPTGGAVLSNYADLLGRVLDHLGIPRAVLVGHSLGGRLVAQLADQQPERALALGLIDAAVGETWDRLVRLSRVIPPVLAGVGGLLLVDALTTLPVLRDPRQAVKLGRLVAPTVVGHGLRPWRMVGPAVSLLRSAPSRPLLERLAEREVPVVVIHGDRDLVVPYQTARDTAELANGWLVTVHGGSHSWLLKDPETLPAIVAELLRGPLVPWLRDVLADVGLDLDTATPDEVESALLPLDAPVRELTPNAVAPDVDELPRPPKQPRYRWTIEPPP